DNWRPRFGASKRAGDASGQFEWNHVLTSGDSKRTLKFWVGPYLAEKTFGRFLKGPEMKGKRIAFDDGELADWLIDLIADGPENFLRAFAEAVVTANADDYGVIRPALIELRRRHCGRVAG